MQSRILLLLIVVLIGAGAFWFISVSKDSTPASRPSAADTARQVQEANVPPPQPVGPRHLTDEVKRQILDRIPLTRKIVINAVPSDSEVADYANEFAKFFADSGYDVEGPNYTITAGSRGMPKGMQINTFDSTPAVPVQLTIGIR